MKVGEVEGKGKGKVGGGEGEEGRGRWREEEEGGGGRGKEGEKEGGGYSTERVKVHTLPPLPSSCSSKPFSSITSNLSVGPNSIHSGSGST